MIKRYKVSFGRSDGSAIKHMVLSKAKALHLANSLSYIFWYQHRFKAADVHGDLVRFEQEGFWVEIKEYEHAAGE